MFRIFRIAVFVAVFSVPVSALGQQFKPCQRFDDGGSSLADVMTQAYIYETVGTSADKAQVEKLKPLVVKAKLVREAMALIPDADWSPCGEDGIILVDPMRHFKASREKREAMSKRIAFSLSKRGEVKVIYINWPLLNSFARRIKENGYDERDVVAVLSSILAHELEHTVKASDESRALDVEAMQVERLLHLGRLSSGLGQELLDAIKAQKRLATASDN